MKKPIILLKQILIILLSFFYINLKTIYGTQLKDKKNCILFDNDKKIDLLENIPLDITNFNPININNITFFFNFKKYSIKAINNNSELNEQEKITFLENINKSEHFIIDFKINFIKEIKDIYRSKKSRQIKEFYNHYGNILLTEIIYDILILLYTNLESLIYYLHNCKDGKNCNFRKNDLIHLIESLKHEINNPMNIEKILLNNLTDEHIKTIEKEKDQNHLFMDIKKRNNKKYNQ